MASSVQVLCPNGRRQNVKVTPNTKLLQVLEEVCLKQGFQPVEEYDLRQGKKTLDPTVIYRYSGLPNHAKLELVKAEKKRAETNVTLALQLESGERLQAEFPPSTPLTDVLDRWKDQTAVKPGLHRVCIYMREEIMGELALAETNLKKLGLFGGKGLLRLVHREVDNSTLCAVEEKIAKEKTKLAKLAASGNALVERQTSASTDMSPSTAMETASPGEVSSSSKDECQAEPMDTEDTKGVESTSESVPKQTVPAEEKESSISEGARSKTSGQKQETQAAGIQFSTPGSNEHLPPQIRAQVQQLAASLVPGADSTTLQLMMQALTGNTPNTGTIVQPFAQGFKFPEESKGKQLYHNELSKVNKSEYKPCDRETVVYSMDESRPSMAPTDEELPESFFEHTESDIRKMWTDLQSRSESDQLLMTNAMRQQHKEARMSKYPRVIIRVHFPERLVLQGVFNVRESVHALHKYVKGHLEDKTRDFYLYTTPPRNVLKDQTQNLFEANLAPMCVVYFGSETFKDANISSAVVSEIATQQVADQVVMKYMGDSSSAGGSDYAFASTSGESSGSGASQASSANKRSSNMASSSSHRSNAPSGSAEDGKVPKWFKVGKK